MVNIHSRPIVMFLAFALLSACAMQRAQDADAARQRMVGMTKEQVFACMGLAKRKGMEGNLEIWAYDSGNGRVDRSRSATTLSRRGRSSGDFFDSLGEAVTFSDDISEKRYCVVQVVMRENRVIKVNYSGPSGGFLAGDEQCAYAVRNCLTQP